MPTYTLQLPASNKIITPGKLGHIYAENQYGQSFGFTDYYMQWNQQPALPVVGEFHFSRFSYLYWEEELRKMKAGGVQIVATYIFWNYHEEEEGIFRWDENRSLKHFTDLCAKVELSLIVRIGPFCHGEVRNGGIPDWMFDKPLEIRSNDPLYLTYTKRLYKQIAKQLSGNYFNEGGPIIAVQLENEYMHCGAPQDSWGYKTGKFISSGKGGNEHLEQLRKLALEAGISPAFFTATAWGGAAVPEEHTLPMLAGYAYTPWIPNQPPSREYIFRDLHQAPAERVHYNSLQYPVAYCEMAGGMQVSYTARPLVSADSVEAMTLVKLASGSNLLGYYMYHGGTNAKGQHGFLNEYGLPKLTYDYQAPLGEFGRVGETYDRIRMLSLFLQAYGSILAPMGPVLPQGQENIEPADTDSLRWTVRQHDGSGFVFMNNFQDHVEPNLHQAISLQLESAAGTVSFPYRGTFDLPANVSTVFPFHLRISHIHIVSATVQPLTIMHNELEDVLVFFAPEGIVSELVLDAAAIDKLATTSGTVVQEEQYYIVTPEAGKENVISIVSSSGKIVKIVVLTREEALQAYRLTLFGKAYLCISSSRLFVKNDQLVSTSEGRASWQVAVYPDDRAIDAEHQAVTSVSSLGIFTNYAVQLAEYHVEAQLKQPVDQHYYISVDGQWPAHVVDLFLDIEYAGDVAALYIGEQMISDHIHYGATWQVGLKQWQEQLEEHPLHVAITPIRKGHTETFVNQALVERFAGVEIAEIQAVKAIPHYRAVFNFK